MTGREANPDTRVFRSYTAYDIARTQHRNDQGHVGEQQVDWVDGEAVPKPGVNADVKPLSLADIARSAGRTGGPVLGRASLNAQGAGASFSCNFADTLVDTETGKVDVLSLCGLPPAREQSTDRHSNTV